jgi:4-amino-4-deoxy-L-arabinose transferase-like glycosyltransferase
VVPMVFFSFSVSKLPGYILPVVPPIAMLCARELRRDTSRLFRIAVFIEAGTMIFIGVAFGFFGGMLNVNPHVDGMLIASFTFVFAAILIVIGLWLKPRILAGFNLAAMLFLVLFGVSLILPRFDLTDTMRPWSEALVNLVPNEQVVYLYKPQRWAEYGLQYYRSGKAAAINTPDQLMAITAGEPQVLCIADNKMLDEVAHIANVDMKIVLALGNQTAFLVWRSK